MKINKNSIKDNKAVENILPFHDSRCLCFAFDELLDSNNYNKNIIKCQLRNKIVCY